MKVRVTTAKGTYWVDEDEIDAIDDDTAADDEVPSGDQQDVDHPDPEAPGGMFAWLGDRFQTSPRVAEWVVGALVAMAAVAVTAYMARDMWFTSDEWEYLANRTAFDLGDLTRPVGGHWTTWSVLLLRGLYNDLRRRLLAVVLHPPPHRPHGAGDVHLAGHAPSGGRPPGGHLRLRHPPRPRCQRLPASPAGRELGGVRRPDHLRPRHQPSTRGADDAGPGDRRRGPDGRRPRQRLRRGRHRRHHPHPAGGPAPGRLDPVADPGCRSPTGSGG